MANTERTHMLQAMAPFAVSSTMHGLTLFTFDFTLYLLAVAGALLLPSFEWQLAASIFAGVKIGNLLTLGHDAAHGTLVRGRTLNRILAVLAFLPCVYNYRMWLFDHHAQHHADTNGDHKDTYSPLTKAEFDALPCWKRVLERFYRHANPASFAIYYIVERWSQAKLFPHSQLPPNARRSAWAHFAIVVAFHFSFIVVLLRAPSYSAHTGTTAVILGFGIPFFTFMFLSCFVLWSMHTHPRARWFRSGLSASKDSRSSALTSVHLIFPRPISWLLHDVTCHPAHHLHPGIPCYRLHQAQARYNELFPGHAVVQAFSFEYVLDTMRRCKLYDFETGSWQDFEGRKTSIVEYDQRAASFSLCATAYQSATVHSHAS